MPSGNVVDDADPEDTVEPGATFTYEWDVPQLAGPEPGDPSSIAWVYYSHVSEIKDVASGLLGRHHRDRGEARRMPTALPKTWTAKSSRSSTHSTKTRVGMCRRTLPPTSAPLIRKRSIGGSANFSDSQGYFTFAGTGFGETNYKFSVNGYLYGDGPVMTVKQGQRVRWYLLDMGDVGALNFHTPHWHGNTVLSHGTRRDTIFLLPLGTETADMVPDAPGLWLFHCHIDDHMEAGMMARYEVLPAPTTTADTK